VADDKALNEAEPNETPEPVRPPPAGRKRPVIKKRVGAKKRVEDLKEPDEFMEVGGTVVDWVLARRKPAGIIVGGILAALLIYGVLGKFDQSSREDASAALFVAQRLLPETSAQVGSGLTITTADPEEQAGKVTEAVAALDKVASDFEGTPQATLARLDAGAALSRAGRYEEALPYFEGASKAKGTMGALAKSSAGSTLESLGRHDEAIAAYEAVRASGHGGTTEQATLDLARALVAKGDTARAGELYAQFEVDFPDSPVLTEVQAKAAAIR